MLLDIIYWVPALGALIFSFNLCLVNLCWLRKCEVFTMMRRNGKIIFLIYKLKGNVQIIDFHICQGNFVRDLNQF